MISLLSGKLNQGFPARMVYLHYISCLRYTILVGNPQNASLKKCSHVFQNLSAQTYSQFHLTQNKSKYKQSKLLTPLTCANLYFYFCAVKHMSACTSNPKNVHIQTQQTHTQTHTYIYTQTLTHSHTHALKPSVSPHTHALKPSVSSKIKKEHTSHNNSSHC